MIIGRNFILMQTNWFLMPYEMPEPNGLPAQITVYKDEDHAHDMMKKRAVSGILIFVNDNPVCQISKLQKQ